jgi:hypothetical protein
MLIPPPTVVRGEGRTPVPGARWLATIVYGIFWGKICVRGRAKLNCHTLALLYLELCRDSTASIQATASSHCICLVRDLRMVAFVFGCAVGQLFLVVYYVFTELPAPVENFHFGIFSPAHVIGRLVPALY